MYALVMAGGSGTRLWPLSRRKTPKQLLPLTGEASLLQQTLDQEYSADRLLTKLAEGSLNRQAA